MYKLSRRKNLIPFAVLFVLGMVASSFLPPLFPNQVFEIPAFALYPAEIALVMMLSVFFFENATPAELIRLSFSMLAICMFAGACSNMHANCSQCYSDGTLLLNWVQLIAMNVTGLVSTIALYQTRVPVTEVANVRTAVRDLSPIKPTDLAHADSATQTEDKLAEKVEIFTGEQAKEMLSKLEGRFNDLESQRQAAAGSNNVSLESLFADESQAAKSGDSNNGKTNAKQSPAKPGSLDSLFDDDADHGFGTSSSSSSASSASELVPDAPSALLEDKSTAPEPTIHNIEETQPWAETPAASLPPVVNEVPLVMESSSIDIGMDDLGLFSDSEPASVPTPAPVVTTPAPPLAKTTDTGSGGKLFDDVSGDLDDIFSNLAAPDALKDVTPAHLAEIKPSAAEPAATAASKTDGKLFDDVSDDLDDIFKSLAPEDAHKQVGDMLDIVHDKPAPSGPSPAPAPAAASSAFTPSRGAEPPAGGDAKPREVKEFGRLSAAATAKTELAAPGTLKTIGQMLLDTHAIENIIKRTEGKDSSPSAASAATAKVVSVSRGADIQNMLNKITSYPGVDGSLVIGKDGLLIGATDSLGMMRDVLGVLALGMHSTTNLGTKKMDMGDLRQAVMRTGQKLTILTEIGIGVLATFCDNWNLSALDGMMEHIGKVVVDSQASGGASLPMETLSGGLLAADAAAPAAAPLPPAPAPVAAPAAVTAEEEAVVSIADAKGGLLNVSDDDLGGLFDNVLADPAKHNDSIGAHAAPTDTAKAKADGAGPVSVSDDDMTDLFDNLLDKSQSSVDISMDFSPESGKTGTGTTEAPAQPPATAPAQPAPAAAPAAAKASDPAAPAESGKAGQQIKEFGRLSASSASQQGSSEGAIKAIGRQLIDVQAVENIIKSGEKREKMGIGAGLTTARVISAARGEGIRALLTKIDGCPGVAGSLIVGNDGLVIASTLQGGLDKDLLGALCTAMHSHTDLAARKAQMGKLRQIIFHANDKLTILTGVAVGVLAVFIEDRDLSKIDSTLQAIESTVRG